MVGSPGRRWEHPQVQSPGVPVVSSPGSGPLAEMLTDGSMLTLAQLSASLTVKDRPPALQSPGAQTFPTLIYLPDSDTCSQTGLGPQGVTFSVVLRKLSFPQSLWQKILVWKILVILMYILLKSENYPHIRDRIP